MQSDKLINILLIVILVLSLIGWSMTLVKSFPYVADTILNDLSNDDDHEYNVYWAITTDSLPIWEVDELHIQYEDFTESLYSNSLRHGCRIVSLEDFIQPEDKYVQRIAEYVKQYTDSDYLRASVALAYVQCAIVYETDSIQFSTDDYALYPVETLFLKKGDCEDTSILLCSIYRALGYESILAQYPSHVAVLITLDGVTYKAETTNYSTLSTNLTYKDHTPEPYTETTGIAKVYAQMSGWVRNGIHTIFGI